MKMVNEIKEIAYHRNGISGQSFHVVRFISGHDGKMSDFLGILFKELGQCAVICLDAIEAHGVKFGDNSWSGGCYEPELRNAIQNWEEHHKQVTEYEHGPTMGQETV